MRKRRSGVVNDDVKHLLIKLDEVLDDLDGQEHIDPEFAEFVLRFYAAVRQQADLGRVPEYVVLAPVAVD